MPDVMAHASVVRALVRVLSLVVLLSVPARAHAQTITLFAGYPYGEDAGCQQATSCEDRTSALGVVLGGGGSFLGFEQEFAYVRNFFGKDPAQSTSVLTVMSNATIGPRIGYVRPFGLIGIGLVKTRVTLTLDDLARSDTSAGWDVGGGLEIAGRHAGLRVDIRRFHGLSDVPLLLYPVENLDLDFSRATAGLVLRF